MTAESLVIRGGRALRGVVRVVGGKNNALPILAAAALAADVSILENVPHCRDVQMMCEILQALGCRIETDADGHLEIDARQLTSAHAPAELCRQIRGSYYAAGVLLARLRQFEVGLPGGDAIGSRPIDFHLKGFQALGATVGTEHGYFVGSADHLRGTEYLVPRQSVGTTLNLMISATLVPGTTVLLNAAREPEITDTAVFLSLMGARIRGAGTSRVVIEGVERLHGASYAIIPDRIEAGTYLIAAAATGGDVTVESLIPEHVTALLSKLHEAGCDVDAQTDAVRVRALRRPLAIDIDTASFPGFATDLQPQLSAMLTVADGRSVVRERVHEGRFGYTDELRRLGAEIRVEGDTAYITSVASLSGAEVQALDIRAGAAVVIGGLVADGETRITSVRHIDRGYDALDEKLRALGGDVARVSACEAGAGAPVPVA
ncbi:MAG: UDP-N-acetylglucosamine 1-carboxyvinyltransferase [Alphaproteobacteria bacterium]|nr:UDP-N-acetylglucosamine 1-carboxyvinyltransferase [Alphaproteobacteria bacterium]